MRKWGPKEKVALVLLSGLAAVIFIWAAEYGRIAC